MWRGEVVGYKRIARLRFRIVCQTKGFILFLNIFSFPFCVRITRRQPDESNVGVELRKTPLGETGLAHLKNPTRTKK